MFSSQGNYALININEKTPDNEIVNSIFDTIENSGCKHYLSEYDKENKRFLYFAHYLKEIEVKTIVFEFNYRDRQYIEDHSHYYNRCFKHYSRRCIRLHFFSLHFTADVLQDFLTCFSREKTSFLPEFKNSYCGFSLIKPLPFTVFGKTCLKTYGQDKDKKKPKKGKRYYDAIRKYDVTLFGIELSVDSVAYQEQDSQIFVCATTALWVAYQCTSKLFDHKIPTPYEITLQATGRKTAGSEGLNPKEIIKSISEQGLHALSFKSFTSVPVKAFLYAYLKAKLPVIIAVKLKSSVYEPEYHCLTALGYDIVPKGKESEVKLCLKSSLIDEIYVHDDQSGPFTRLKFDKKNNAHFEGTDWAVKKMGKNVEFELLTMIVPLYHKIHISFEKILDITEELNTCAFPGNKDYNILWNIYLTTVAQLKKNLMERENTYIDKSLYRNILLQILTNSLPKYIWIVEALDKTDKSSKFSFYFDATDMENSDFLLFYLPDNESEYIGLLNCMLSVNEHVSAYTKMKNDISYQTRQIFEYIIREKSKRSEIGEIIENMLYEGVQKFKNLKITKNLKTEKIVET
ncbi:MAG: hypothetical protein LBG80_02380 [Bacteroidales bacterium]|jgi:hypothetical protein|nr:hypothetical protein [Bacteroidales bacterium]